MAGPTLTPVQMAAVDQMANPKNNPGSAFFLTGEAGVGKSEVIRALIRRLNENFRNHVYVTATTGVAAVEIGGATLASFLGVGIDGDTLDTAWVDQRIKEINTERKLYKVKERLLLVTHLIIDEVSMMKAQFWSNLDSILRGIRRNQLPYGGVIVIAVGDFFQLPPVQKRGVPKDDRRFFAFQVYLPPSPHQPGLCRAPITRVPWMCVSVCLMLNRLLNGRIP
jgi:ATP-dependent DNA helicase PIF1